MATKNDLRAQKDRKQKIILAVGGVLLVGVVALQAPKLLNHFKSAPAAAPATTPGVTTPGATTPTDTTAGTTTPTPAPSIPVATPTKYSAQLAGVVITPASTPAAAQGQLFSFSRFKTKDPFVQQVNPSGAGSSSASSGTTTASNPGTTGTPSAPGSPQASGPTGPLTNATLLVNGRPQRLVLRQLFPKYDPIFVLVKLTQESARIGVAGGSFTAGNTILLQMGKRVTLMNTTTGQRYIVKLVYVGLTPETIAGFKAPAAQSSGSTTTAVPGATQASSPTTVPATTTPATTTSYP